MNRTKEIPFANSLAAITAFAYIVCVIFVMLFPGLTMTIWQSWAHGLDLSSLVGWQPSFGSLLWGLVTMTVSAWLFGYGWAWLYGRWSK